MILRKRKKKTQAFEGFVQNPVEAKIRRSNKGLTGDIEREKGEHEETPWLQRQ